MLGRTVQLTQLCSQAFVFSFSGLLLLLFFLSSQFVGFMTLPVQARGLRSGVGITGQEDLCARN